MENKEIIISASDKVKKAGLGDDEHGFQYLFNNKRLEEDLTNSAKTIQEIEEEKISDILNNFIGEQFENTTILTGAGASIINHENRELLSEYSGKTVWELTKEINDHLWEESILNDSDLFSLEEFVEKVKYFTGDERYSVEKVNIEDLLSKAESAKEYISINEDEKVKFDGTLYTIEEKIKELCTLQLHKFHPHPRFLEKVTMRRSSHNRVKLFTTNYDTLFEQAAEQEGFILVDGFTYNFPRKFNPFIYDYDFVRRGDNKVTDEPDYVEKVIHLYKLHGSIDWERRGENEIVKQEDPKHALMIYPRRNKYEQSYEPPYFEMFSRFQLELRKKNTLFISIGFSFADKHIRTIVENAMKNNPSLRILIVDYDLQQESFKVFRDRIDNGYQNIMLFQGDFSRFENFYLKQKAFSDQFFEDTGDKYE
ncbi:SIR2 family protein [Ornithinibacillus contaminans]|uniref:SIR2 family protein n=1 Tax=Ornithinibacillus contaminans TaxID=694055 RepID=UPI00069F78CE|nr:SIR2 family protein [Ornithinibacillus contaminans]